MMPTGTGLAAQENATAAATRRNELAALLPLDFVEARPSVTKGRALVRGDVVRDAFYEGADIIFRVPGGELVGGKVVKVTRPERLAEVRVKWPKDGAAAPWGVVSFEQLPNDDSAENCPATSMRPGWAKIFADPLRNFIAPIFGRLFGARGQFQEPAASSGGPAAAAAASSSAAAPLLPVVKLVPAAPGAGKTYTIATAAATHMRREGAAATKATPGGGCAAVSVGQHGQRRDFIEEIIGIIAATDEKSDFVLVELYNGATEEEPEPSDRATTKGLQVVTMDTSFHRAAKLVRPEGKFLLVGTPMAISRATADMGTRVAQGYCDEGWLYDQSTWSLFLSSMAEPEEAPVALAVYYDQDQLEPIGGRTTVPWLHALHSLTGGRSAALQAAFPELLRQEIARAVLDIQAARKTEVCIYFGTRLSLALFLV